MISSANIARLLAYHDRLRGRGQYWRAAGVMRFLMDYGA